MRPTNRPPTGLCAPLLWWSVSARALPASKTDEELAGKHTKAADAKHFVRQHLPLQSVFCPLLKKKMSAREGNGNHSPMWANLSLLTYARAGTVDTKVDAGVGGCLRRKTGKRVSSRT